MKIRNLTKGFTLIELLVVITIIGILATGGIAIFTKQLQGARDSTRISDVKLFQTAAEMYHSDNDLYPLAIGFTGAIEGYMSKKLQDPKATSALCWKAVGDHTGKCNGYYLVANDSFGLLQGSMKLGILFEKEENFTNIAKNIGVKGDGGAKDYVYEVFAGAGAGTGIIIDPEAGTPSGTKIY